MSRRRDKASSSMAAAAMSLVQLERWLQDRAERRPVATSLPMLDGFTAAIVAGPVSISPLDWICPLLAIDPRRLQPRWHGGVRGDLRRRAAPQRHQQHPLDQREEVRADPSAQAERRRRCASLVPGIPRRHAAATIGLGTAARYPQHQPRPAAAHPAALCGRSGPPAAWTCKEGPRDQGISAQRPHRYPGGRRAMRQYWMPIRYARTG